MYNAGVGKNETPNRETNVTTIKQKCEACQVLIDQAEIDSAREIYDGGISHYCTPCAEAFAESKTDDPNAGEPE